MGVIAIICDNLQLLQPRTTKEYVCDFYRDDITFDCVFVRAQFERNHALLPHELYIYIYMYVWEVLVEDTLTKLCESN